MHKMHTHNTNKPTSTRRTKAQTNIHIHTHFCTDNPTTTKDPSKQRNGSKGPTYKVMLHNDPVNRREYVVKTLLKVIKGITAEMASTGESLFINVRQRREWNDRRLPEFGRVEWSFGMIMWSCGILWFDSLCMYMCFWHRRKRRLTLEREAQSLLTLTHGAQNIVCTGILSNMTDPKHGLCMNVLDCCAMVAHKGCVQGWPVYCVRANHVWLL